MKKALLTLSALALCMAAGSALAKEYKELRFGVDPSYAPFESKAADGSLVGFDIDLGNAICAELKVKCKWVESDFDGMIPGLKANKFDGVISSMTVTPAREKVIDFSDELFSGPTAYVFKKGSGLSEDVTSLKGKTVGYEQGTIQEAYAKAVLDKAGVLDPERMRPHLPERSNDELSILAEMAVKAAEEALARWGKPASGIGAVICAASNM